MCNIDNPFKVGDKVKVKRCFAEKYSRVFNLYAAVESAKVIAIHGSHIVTDIDKQNPTDYIHFELYKEPIQEKQSMKTKRIPFSEDLWTRNRTCSVFWKPTNTEILYFSRWLDGHNSRFIGVYKAPESEYCATTFNQSDFSNMELETPVTTKRIPFDANRKDACVLYAGYDVLEWVAMQGGAFVAITYKTGLDTTISLIVSPNDLVMEIEE